MFHVKTTPHNIICNVPNIKKGPNIQLDYKIEKQKSWEELIVRGNVMNADSNEQFGDFQLYVNNRWIQLRRYYPIGDPEDSKEEWMRNRGRYISRTFLHWLSQLAIVNEHRPICINTRWMYNFYVFRKYFADEIRVSISHNNAKWHNYYSLDKKIGILSNQLMREIEIGDVSTLEPMARVYLKRVDVGQYKVTRVKHIDRKLADLVDKHSETYSKERCLDKLKYRSIVYINKKGFVNVDEKVIGIVLRPSVKKISLSLRGKPRIPKTDSTRLEATVKNFSLEGYPKLVFKYLAT